jgi:hypothetical protein
MHTVQRNEGRLIETRIVAPLEASEVDAIIQLVRINALAVPGKVVFVSDLTRLDGLAPDAVDAFTGMFMRDNPRLERSALLLPRNPGTLGLQLSRMIRNAKSPSRMAFDDKLPLQAWLEEVLGPAERSALRAFLAAVDIGIAEPPSSRTSRRPPPSR